MREKNISKYFILFILLFAVGCNGVVFKTFKENSSDNTPPRVASVSSTGLYEVRVEFSEEVDDSTATNTAHYEINGLTVVTGVLDSGSKVVRLTTSFQSYITYEITVSGIEDKKGNEMQTDYQGTFVGSQDAPRIVTVSTASTDRVRITFSESVEQTSAENSLNYTISPSIGFASVTRDPDTSSQYDLVEILLSEDMENTNYTIKIENVTDLAGNNMDPYYDQQSFLGDARPKIIRITSTASDEILIQFSEVVNIDDVSISDSVDPYTNDHIRVQNLDTPGYLDVTSILLDPEDNSKLIASLGAAQTTSERYKVILYSDLASYGVKDTNGNYVQDSTSGYFIGDGPFTIVSVQPSGPNTLIVTFSEEINDSDTTNANTEANFRIPGLSDPVSAASWPYNSDKSKVRLITPTQNQQIYTLIVEVGSSPPPYNFHSADFLGPEPVPPAINRDVLHEGYNTYSFQGDGLPTLLSAVAIDNNTVKVVFSESVELATAENMTNYSITATGYPSLTVTGASRNPEPNSNEVILTTSPQLYVNYTVEATSVQDTTGNTIVDNDTTNRAVFAGIGTDNTPPSILSATAPSTSSVRIYFNEAVEETTAENTAYYSLEGIATATITVSGTPVADEWFDITVDSVTITLTAKAVEDVSQRQFINTGATGDIAYSIVKCINSDASSPVRAYVNESDVELVSKTLGLNGNITVDLANITNLTSASNDSVSYSPTGATRSDGNSAQVDLSGFAIPTNGLYLLKVVNVEDTATPANKISTLNPATYTLAVRSSGDTTPPQLSGIYAEDSTHLRLLFDEPVEFISANNPDHYCIERQVAEVQIVGSISSGQYLTIEYDLLGPAFAFTATAVNNNPNFSAGEFLRNQGIDGLVEVLNYNASSPVYAHAEGNLLKIARRTGGSGSIDSVTGTLVVSTNILPVNYANNISIISAARNESLIREVILTTGQALSTADYTLTANNISDISVTNNKNSGGTQILLPLGATQAPSGDSTPPEIVGAEAISDSLVRVVFSEPLDEPSAENINNYTIVNPNLDLLGITSAVRDDINTNIVRLYTEYQSPVMYTLTVSGIQDSIGNTVVSSSTTFSGMGAVSVENGPVGNTINGIGNIGNRAVTAMGVYDGKLYVATYNEPGNIKQTEVFASDSIGVYFTMINNPGFNPPVDSFRQRTTTSFSAFDIDDDGDDDLLASTADAPADDAYVFRTENPAGISITPHTWTEEKNMGNDSPNRLLSFGLDENSEHLYILTSSGLHYWDPDALPPAYQNFSFTSFKPNCYVAFGGRMYIGGTDLTSAYMRVYRSTGANAGFPQGEADFEMVLDASTGSGMDGYDDNDQTTDSHYADSNSTNVTSIAVFKGYVYVGSYNTYGAQVWRSQDGLTWERVLDFGQGTLYGGIGDEYNKRITSMKVNGNYLYVGTRNVDTDGSVPAVLGTGAEVWRSPDGVTWNLFVDKGFGTNEYYDVSSMESFLNLIYFGAEAYSGGGAIFRSNN
jgi:hypothetical protein